MTDDFLEYCGSVGMGNSLKQQVSEFHDQLVSFVPAQPIEDIFIGEYVTNDGTRQDDTLHFFTNSNVFEIENFVSKPKIWIVKYGPSYLEMSKEDFDLSDPIAGSRLNIRVEWEGQHFELNMRASGENCSKLLDVVRRHILPRVVAN